MKEFPLTNGQVALVDDIDFMYLLGISANWGLHDYGYIRCQKGPNRKENKYYMHTEVAKRMGLNISNKIDHRDGDPANNQRYNLREATHSQNLMNRGCTIANKLGEKCIYYDYTRDKYMVQVKVNKIFVFKKRFDTLEEAIIERDKAIIKYHGDFSNLG